MAAENRDKVYSSHTCFRQPFPRYCNHETGTRSPRMRTRALWITRHGARYRGGEEQGWDLVKPLRGAGEGLEGRPRLRGIFWWKQLLQKRDLWSSLGHRRLFGSLLSKHRASWHSIETKRSVPDTRCFLGCGGSSNGWRSSPRSPQPDVRSEKRPERQP